MWPDRTACEKNSYHGGGELTALDERILDVAICSRGHCRRTEDKWVGDVLYYIHEMV